MSNYPPGVSGFEPQIAGYPERSDTRPVNGCGKCDAEIEEAEGELVFYTGEVTFYWECPECQFDNETDVTDQFEE
jgi:hypothetical protein